MNATQEKQVNLIDEILETIENSLDTMFNDCEDKTLNKTTEKANEIYNANYKEFNELLMDVAQKLAIYRYNLQQK